MRDSKNDGYPLTITAAQLAEWNKLAEVWTAEAVAETARIGEERHEAAFQRFMARVLNG